MKKFILGLIVCLSITSLTFANGVCNIHGEFIGNKLLQKILKNILKQLKMP